MFKPYESENLIFIDTEFTDLDPSKAELLSIGIVKLNGDELYIELEHEGPVSAWVNDNIIKDLRAKKHSKTEAKKLIEDFLGDSNPFAVAFVDNYDVILLTDLLGWGDDLPFRWATIDFASVLFSIGINPVKFKGDKQNAAAFYRKIGVDTQKYEKHNSLEDAKKLREIWIKTLEHNN